MEGCAPKDEALEILRQFLSQHCAKPDGIEIVRGDVIPIKVARGIAPRTLARRYINGPANSNAAPPAFMYILYYDYGVSRNFQSENILHRGARTVPVQRPPNAKPYAETYIYPGIYFNTRFSFGLAMNEILLHETGHLLGLVSRSAKARDGHCRNRGCQMNGHLQYLRQFRWLPGRKQSSLCAECARELGAASTQSSLPNKRYVGAVLVRSEPDYHVLTLPDRVGLVVGRLTERDCAEFANAMRSERPEAGNDSTWRLFCVVKDEVLKDPAKPADIAHRFKDDPLHPVRRSGPQVFLEACSRRYRALGQNSNMIEALREKFVKPE